MADFQLLVRLLHDDDGSVHEGTAGHGKARHRHDVDADSHVLKGNERHENRDRHRDNRDDGTREMPQEEQYDEDDGDDDFDERIAGVCDGAPNQLRAIVDGHRLDARRHARGNVRQSRLHPLDDFQGIAAVAHDDNAGDDLSRAVEVRGAAPDVRTEHDLTDIPDADRRAILTCKNDALDVPGRLGVTAPANHVLGPGRLEQACADLTVAGTHRIRHAGDRDPVGAQAIRIDVDLILLSEPAERCDLGHARNRFQVILEIPVLVRAQLRQTVPARFVLQDVLKNPAQTGRIGTDLGFDPRGQPRGRAGEVLECPGACPIDIRALFEDHVNVRETEVRDAADRSNPRGAGHRGNDRIGDLVFDDVRAAIPPAQDGDLGFAQVRRGIQRQMHHHPGSPQAARRNERKNEEFVVGAEADEARDRSFQRLQPREVPYGAARTS